MRKHEIVRWFIVSTIGKKTSPQCEISWVCLLTPRIEFIGIEQTHFSTSSTHSRLNIFCSLNREKGSEKSFWIFLYNAFGLWWKCQNGIFWVLYKEIFMHSLPSDSPREVLVESLLLQPLQKWRRKSPFIRGDINEPQHETIFLHPTARNELNFLLMRWNFLYSLQYLLMTLRHFSHLLVSA